MGCNALVEDELEATPAQARATSAFHKGCERVEDARSQALAEGELESAGEKPFVFIRPLRFSALLVEA